MNFKSWATPFEANNKRAIELLNYQYDGSAMYFVLYDEEEDQKWKVSFESYTAMKVVSEECSASIQNGLPEDGAFYLASESHWLTEIGKGEVSFLDEAVHFVMCCYDEIVEIVSSESEVCFSKLT